MSNPAKEAPKKTLSKHSLKQATPSPEPTTIYDSRHGSLQRLNERVVPPYQPELHQQEQALRRSLDNIQIDKSQTMYKNPIHHSGNLKSSLNNLVSRSNEHLRAEVHRSNEQLRASTIDPVMVSEMKETINVLCFHVDFATKSE